ncbi:MAG: hypothetical protein MK135_07060 [Polyangiaceae bacterium]|nr:hypothetical protein [Polyangiaceae bacterium]
MLVISALWELHRPSSRSSNVHQNNDFDSHQSGNTASWSLPALIAAIVPTLFALNVGSAAQIWRSDAAVQALHTYSNFASNPQGSVSVSTDGVGPSLWMAQAFQFMPFGSLHERATWAGAIALGIAGLLIYQLTFLQLVSGDKARRPTTHISLAGHSQADWIALAISLGVVLTCSWSLESRSLHGAIWAAIGALAAQLFARTHRPPYSRSKQIILGSAVFLFVAEAPVFGSGFLFLLFLTHPRRSWPFASLTSGLVAGLAYHCLTHPFAEWHAFRNALTVDATSPWVPWSLMSWGSELGLFLSVMALLGLGTSILWRSSPMSQHTVALALIALDFLIPAQNDGIFLLASQVPLDRMALHLTALASLAPAAAEGLLWLRSTPRQNQVFGAQTIGVLALCFAFATVLAHGEESKSKIEKSLSPGPARIAEQALSPLAPQAVILTSTPQLTQRLRAAQSLGVRPDVSVIALSELQEEHVLQDWLAVHPALKPLARDLNILGEPSERGLDILARGRAVYLQPNRNWRPRLLEHLVPGFPISQFSPQSLDRSERTDALQRLKNTLLDLNQTLASLDRPDRVSLRFVDGELEELAAMMERAHDRSAQERVFEIKNALEPNSKKASSSLSAGVDRKGATTRLSQL